LISNLSYHPSFKTFKFSVLSPGNPQFPGLSLPRSAHSIIGEHNVDIPTVTSYLMGCFACQMASPLAPSFCVSKTPESKDPDVVCYIILSLIRAIRLFNFALNLTLSLPAFLS